MERKIPEWFNLSENRTPATLQRLSQSLASLQLPLQVKHLPLQAFWFLSNSLYLANQANRAGMHANALAVTRQCLEAMSIIELGLSPLPSATDMLQRWEQDKVEPGHIRKWLESNAWPSYGCGLWTEPWSDFMGKLARAIQPYAHYSGMLAQWQERLHGMQENRKAEDLLAIVECGPRTYDPQKATRITLYHALISFALARIWLATVGVHDKRFADSIDQLRLALGKTVYLDGPGTNWDHQFWAMMFFKNGSQNPE